MNFLEIYYTDVYKTGHKLMLPEGSTLMYSNLTPRSNKRTNVPGSEGVVSFGQQMLVRKLKEDWDNNFFSRPIEEIKQFGQDMTTMLMLSTPFDVTHFEELHKLGYLPLRIKAIEEGNVIPYKVPFFTIVNTKPLNGMVFDWLVNYLETILSAESWLAPTSATLGKAYRDLGKKWLTQTDPDNLWFLDYQFHDFSMRGMQGKSSLVSSGLGFATASRGSDTLPVIPASRKFYDEPKNETVINSVIATEHAIMCSLTGFFLQQDDGSWENVGKFEVETFRYLLKKFPSGVLSLVSDTWSLWRVITEYCVVLKDEILARDGKLVIRPDSGDPVDIICGTNDKIYKLTLEGEGSGFRNCLNDFILEMEEGDVFHFNEKYYKVNDISEFNREYGINAHYDTWSGNEDLDSLLSNDLIEYHEYKDLPSGKGVIELLWEVFGGTTNAQGYKVLDSHIGAIYGDAITLERAGNIFSRLADKGFASSNIVLGVGSFSMTYVTRDTHGFAQKATYIELKQDVPGEGGGPYNVGVEIFKDPVTDSGIKKSARGLLRVDKVNGIYTLKDQCTWKEESGGELQVIYEDGYFHNQTTLTKIRERLWSL